MDPADVPVYEGRSPLTRWQGEDLCLLNRSDDFDPTSGWVYRSEYVGTPEAVADFLTLVNPYKVRVNRRVEGDKVFLTLTSPDPTFGGGIPPAPEEVPVDTYEFSTEFEMEEIWSNPKVIQQTYSSSDSVQIAVLSKYKQFVTTRLESLYSGWVSLDEEVAGAGAAQQRGKGPTPMDKTGLLDSTTLSPTPEAIAEFSYPSGSTDSMAASRVVALSNLYWMHVMRGSTELNWSNRHIVLSRRRSVSATFAEQIEISGVETIYTTAALGQEFEIPPDIMARLPPDPTTTPYRTRWGWKVRRQDSTQVPRTGRVEEVLDWAFAAWSIDLYVVQEATA